MANLTSLARMFLAVAMIAFGLQHFIYLDFVTRVFPGSVTWIHARPFWACVGGAILVIAGLAIILGKSARLAALLLGAVILASFVLLHLPLLIASPSNGGIWTQSGKALALAGGSFLVAGSLPSQPLNRGGSVRRATRFLDKLIPLSPFFLGAFLVVCGILHFIYVDFVATLVPSWIPWHIFWTYFAGVALIAGGIGMLVPATSRLAAWLTAAMIFVWVLVLHIPRALADIHNSNETTAVFEALAVTGAAILVATRNEKGRT